MSKKDVEIFKGMVSNPVKHTKKEDNIPSLINRIILILRNKDKNCSINEIEKELKEKDLLSIPRFKSELLKCPKIKYEEKTQTLAIKSKYAINNIEELKAKIRESENGIPEDDELKDVYPGVKNDIEKLKNENFVRVIENDEKSNVLFFRDTSDKFEQKLVDPNYKPAIDLLRKIWKDELRYYDTSEKSQFIVRKRRPSHDLNIKATKRRKITQRANTHLLLDIFNKN